MKQDPVSSGSRTGAPVVRADPVRPVVFYVQPLIASYRVEVIESLNRLFAVKVFACSDGIEAEGFSREQPVCDTFVETRIVWRSAPVHMQAGVVGRMVRERPSAVLIFADVRYLSLWLALVAGRLMRVPVLIHGQGLYRHGRAGLTGLARACCYRLAVALATRYICYTERSRQSLERVGCPAAKLVVANNSLSVSGSVGPWEKSGAERGVLFIGRLRERSQIEVLIDVIGQLRSEGLDMALHVIGDGEQRVRLQQEYGDCGYVTWYGAVFDSDEIAAVSQHCRVGCHPGSAGLSVVHMFALSLPPVVHDRLSQHMGPEPGYIEDGHTGFLFAREGDALALAATLRRVWSLRPDTMLEVAGGAYARYGQLNSPPLGHQLAEIVEATVMARARQRRATH